MNELRLLKNKIPHPVNNTAESPALQNPRTNMCLLNKIPAVFPAKKPLPPFSPFSSKLCICLCVTSLKP